MSFRPNHQGFEQRSIKVQVVEYHETAARGVSPSSHVRLIGAECTRLPKNRTLADTTVYQGVAVERDALSRCSTAWMAIV